VNVTAIVATGLAAYAVGVRADALFWIAGLGWFPVSAVLLNITLRLFAPDAELTGEFRGILYGEREQPAEAHSNPGLEDESEHTQD
jgi:hypothetical protein